MSLWSMSTPRKCLLDVNRGRFENHEVPPSASADVPSPAAYNPKITTFDKPVSPWHACNGPTERQRTLADGRPVRSLISAGPGSYDLSAGLPRKTSPSKRQAPFGSCMNRPLNMISPANAVSRREYDNSASMPAPGQYLLPSLLSRRAAHITETTTFSRSVSPQMKSGSVSPPLSARVQGGHSVSPTMTLDLVSSPRSHIATPPHIPSPPSRSKQSQPLRSPPSSPRKQATKPQQQLQHHRGVTISTAPRYFNLNDINSRKPIEEDSNFSNPPASAYSPKDDYVKRPATVGGKFSHSPRRIQLCFALRGAPGPGSYEISRY